MWYPGNEIRIKNCFQVSNLDNQVNAPIISNGKKIRRMRLKQERKMMGPVLHIMCLRCLETQSIQVNK